MAREKSLRASLGSKSLRFVRPRRYQASPHLTSLLRARWYMMDASLNFPRLKYLFPVSTYVLASARGSPVQAARTRNSGRDNQRVRFPGEPILHIHTSGVYGAVLSLGA